LSSAVNAPLPARVAIPRDLLVDALPEMTEIAEIQVTLAAARLLADRGGDDALVEEREIVRDAALRRALRVPGSPNEPDTRIATGLELAVGRGTLLRVRTRQARDEQVWYLLANDAGRTLVYGMTSGAIAPPSSIWLGDAPPAVEPERPTIFRLYEQNIALLTPLIAEQLVRAMETYPRDWIEDAIAEAVSYNRRSWRYVQSILQTWATQGRDDGQTRGPR